MTDNAADKQKNRSKDTIAVASILGSDRVVINRGTQDGVRMGQTYLVYVLSDEEVTDPTTGESLGRLEIPKGTGTIVHAQNHMATLESDKELTNKQSYADAMLTDRVPTQGMKAPFRNPRVGDLAKRLSLW